MTTLQTVLGVTSVAFVLACSSASHADPPAAAASSAGDFRYKKALTAGAKVEIRNVNGPITAEPSSGDAFEVVAVKSGRGEDVARVQVTVREDAGVIVVCALLPGEDPSSCRVGGRIGSSEGSIDARVDFKVRVPAAVASFAARTMNGRITATGLRGEARLSTMNGAVDVDAAGPTVATTMNGAVSARVAAGVAVRLETTNGAITLSLPASAGADVDASTTAGTITSDFGSIPPPSVPGVMHAARFRVGAGGAAVTLRTTHGDVRVRRL